MKRQKRHLLILLPALLLLLALAFPSAASAANPAKITACKLISTNRFKVTATASDTGKIRGNKCYLFALSLSDTGIPSGARPLKSVKKAKNMSFSLKLNDSDTSSRLYQRFVLAAKDSGGAYSIISNARYLTNPKKAAAYKYSFPTAVSKKGLQVSADMLEDAAELNVRHSLINIVFTDLIATKAEENPDSSISYRYHGNTYWFRRPVVSGYDRQLTALQESDAVVSAVLLLGWRADLTNLIYPSGREQGHSYYAWNTTNTAAREQLQATVSFLASRYASSSAQYGRIVNWIVGNEVNNYKVYNYAGALSLNSYAKVYADAFRMAYNAVTSVYANARLYISLDHLWNTNSVSGTFAARKMLDAFAGALKSEGNIRWNLAYHPYSSPLTEPRFWANTNRQLTKALTSPVINMGNIGVLTSYIRQTYGSKTRIILSEQGYTSVRHAGSSKTDAQKEQSAAIAYSYYLTESDSMIDSFIMNRHVDHEVEVKQGLDLGLWTTDTSSGKLEWAGSQKDSWNVFKYMDTNKSKSVTSEYLPIVGASSWSSLIPNFSKKLYSKTSIASADLLQVSSYRQTAPLASAWKQYGASTGMTASGGTLRAAHDNTRNRNSLWGFSQTLAKKVSFAKHPVFYTTLQVSGSTAPQVKVKLRFYSDKRILESEAVIPANRPVSLGVSLAKWKYRKKVTKIQVLIAPAGGTWNTGAALSMSLPVRGQ